MPALDLTVSDTAELVGFSRRSTGAIFLKIRRRLAEACEHNSFTTSGEVEIDESYFGPRRVRGKRGRGALNAIAAHLDYVRPYFLCRLMAPHRGVAP